MRRNLVGKIVNFKMCLFDDRPGIVVSLTLHEAEVCWEHNEGEPTTAYRDDLRVLSHRQLRLLGSRRLEPLYQWAKRRMPPRIRELWDETTPL